MKLKLKHHILCLLTVFIILNSVEPIRALNNNSGSFSLKEEIAGLITKHNQIIGNGQWFGGFGIGAGALQDFALMKDAATNEFIYCIEPGVYSQGGDSYGWRDINDMFNYVQNTYNNRTNAVIKKRLVARILCLVTDENRYDKGTDSRLQYMALQTLMWEVVCGERDATFKYIGPTYGSSVQSLMTFNSPSYEARYWELKNQYEEVLLKFNKSPTNTSTSSSTAPTIILDQYNTTTGEYYKTFKDTNNVAKWYNFSGNGVSVTVDNNSNITVKCETPNYTSLVSGYNKLLERDLNKAESYITGHSSGMAQYTVSPMGIKDPSRDSFFYVKSELKYNIKYDGNGATSGNMATQTLIYNQNANLLANNYKRIGYKFLGWNTKKDGTGTSYKDGATVKNLSSTNGATVTLYAQWQNTAPTITVPILPNPLPPTNSNIPPYISGNNVIIQLGDKFNPLDYVTASDPEDGNLTDKIKIVKNPVPTDSQFNTTVSGSYIIDLKVSDSGGLNSTAKLNVIVNDPPMIIPEDRYYYKDSTVTKDNLLEKVIAQDKEDGDISDKVDILSIKYSEENIVTNPSDLNTSDEGMFEIIYTVTDSYKKTVTNTANIFIISSVPPEELEQYTRFISSDFLDTLASNSIWCTEPYRTTLLESLNGSSKMEWNFKAEQVELIKEFIRSQNPSEERNQEFYDQFSQYRTK